MTQILRQSTAVDVLIGPFVDSTDGYTSEEGLSPAVELSKNGQALAAKNDATTPVVDDLGCYNCELDATDTNTVGTLVLIVEGSATALPVRHEFQVLDEPAYDAIYGSTGAMLTAKDIGLVYEGSVSTVNSQTSFDMDTGIANDDIYIGLTCTVEDVSTGDSYATWVTDIDQANDRIIIAAAPPFTVTAATPDKVRIHAYQHPTYMINNTAPTFDVNVARVVGKVLVTDGTGGFNIGEA